MDRIDLLKENQDLKKELEKHKKALDKACKRLVKICDSSGMCEYTYCPLEVDKEIPKKPIITIINKKYGSYQCDCPACGRFISVNCKDITTVYCPECGQRIDWKD